MQNEKSKFKDEFKRRIYGFALEIIKFIDELPKEKTCETIGNQLLRSATSIGANYCEANGASSKKDFMNKIFICKKESRESKYWLRVLASALDEEKLKDECRGLWKEAQEFNLIFSKIVSKK